MTLQINGRNYQRYGQAHVPKDQNTYSSLTALFQVALPSDTPIKASDEGQMGLTAKSLEGVFEPEWVDALLQSKPTSNPYIITHCCNEVSTAVFNE
jgi:hypothetical protein